MLKPISLALAVAACAALALASPAERQACVARSAEYLARAKIDAPVQTLVAKSREFYPDAIALIKDEAPGDDYEDALKDIGDQVGCSDIITHFQRLPQEVACYKSLKLEMDDDSTLDVARLSEQAKEVIEAYFACLASRDHET